MFEALFTSGAKAVSEHAPTFAAGKSAAKSAIPIETKLPADGIRAPGSEPPPRHYGAQSRAASYGAKAEVAPKVKTLEEAGFSSAEITKINATMAHQASLPSVNLSKPEINDLVDKNYAAVNPAQKKQMHLILGNSGAGKSHYIADDLVSRENARLLDADHIKPQIHGYDRGTGNQAVHKASTDVINAMMVKSIKNGDNVVHSMCGTTVDSVTQKLAFAKQNGYDVHLHLADIPAEKSARRVFERGFNAPESQAIRQMIPPTYPLSVGDKPRNVFNELKDRSEYLQSHNHLNTDVPLGSPAIVVSQRTPAA